MLTPIKVVVSNRANLANKYGKLLPRIDALLKQLQKADKKKKIDTRILFVDDAASCKAIGIKNITTFKDADYKDAIDRLYNKLTPAYIVLLGAGDVFPFQTIPNPADDDDKTVESDLPYACDAPYSKTVRGYTGPTRVVSRIPDRHGDGADISIFKTIITNSIQQKQLDADKYRQYFSVTAQVWTKSTQKSLLSMFGNADKLVESPGKSSEVKLKYPAAQLKPLTHFYNCHGAPSDNSFYGQKGKKYPVAQQSNLLEGKISEGAIVAAECCYGAQLYDPTKSESQQDGISLTYLKNGAIAFAGSSTIAYGPSDSNALADLITQYFIKNILKGNASAGRAFLEARQRFLTDSGPQLDPYELKTLAQFYLLGDASVVPVKAAENTDEKSISGTTVFNTRAALATKGQSLQNSIQPSAKLRTVSKSGDAKALRKLLKEASFEDVDAENMYSIAAGGNKKSSAKTLGANARYRTYIKKEAGTEALKLNKIKVLVVKEDDQQLLGWRMYESR